MESLNCNGNGMNVFIYIFICFSLVNFFADRPGGIFYPQLAMTNIHGMYAISQNIHVFIFTGKYYKCYGGHHGERYRDGYGGRLYVIMMFPHVEVMLMGDMVAHMKNTLVMTHMKDMVVTYIKVMVDMIIKDVI